MDEAEQVVREKEPTAHTHWKQAEMPICEIITDKGKQLGFARNVSTRTYAETVAAAWQDAARRMDGK